MGRKGRVMRFVLGFPLVGIAEYPGAFPGGGVELSVGDWDMEKRPPLRRRREGGPGRPREYGIHMGTDDERSGEWAAGGSGRSRSQLSSSRSIFRGAGALFALNK